MLFLDSFLRLVFAEGENAIFPGMLSAKNYPKQIDER